MLKSEINAIKNDAERIAARKVMRRIVDRQVSYQHEGRKYYDMKGKQNETR